MKRRITAALLALSLLLMIPVLPVNTRATDSEDTTVYPIGYMDMWVVGIETVPTAQTEPGGKWARVYKADGTQESKAGVCPEHECGSGCYDVAGNKTCGVPAGEEHKHSIKCSIYATVHYAQYRWQVVPDESAAPEVTEPPTEESDTTTPTEEEYDDGTATLYIQNVNTEGEPLDGVQYLLLKYVDGEAFIKGSARTQDGGVAKLTGIRLTGEEDTETWRLVQNALTGDLGKAYKTNTTEWDVTIVRNADGTHTLKSVALHVEEEEDSSEETEPEETEVENAPNYDADTCTLTVINERWQGTIKVDVIVEGFGTTVPGEIKSTVTVTGSDEEDEEFQYEEILEFPVTKTNLYTQQADLSVSRMGTYKVTATDPVPVDGYNVEGPIIQRQSPPGTTPETKNEITFDPQHSVVLFTVTYRYTPIEEPTEAPTTEPTEAPTTEPTEEPTTEPTEAPTTEPTEEPTTDPTEAPTTEPTEEPTTDPTGEPTTDPTGEPTTDPTGEPTTDPTGKPTTDPTGEPTTDPTTKPSGDSTTSSGTTTSASNTIIVKVIDDREQALKGAEIALYDGKTQLAKWQGTYDNVFVLDDLEKYVKEGESVTYTLSQTKAPAGYRISGDSFTVKISNQNGKTEVDVKKNVGTLENLFKGNGIEVGTDGKQIVTFRNARKTTQLELTCQVEVSFSEDSWVDEALAAEYQKQQYEFVLTWENAEGEQQTESILLAHGETGLFEAEIPYDTPYEVTVVNPDGSFTTEFSENAAGTVDSAQIKENITVESTQKYAIESGEPLTLSLVKVDASTKLPLQGASFDLTNPEGLKVGTYTSSESGEMVITGVFDAPGTYLLKETATLEGYALLSEPVSVNAAVSYTLDTEKGTPVLLQTMTAELSHRAVVQESDGSYWIENELTGEETEPEESDGLGLGAIFGIVAVLAAAAGTVVFVLTKKKRK